jgi:hypothetical protein
MRVKEVELQWFRWIHFNLFDKVSFWNCCKRLKRVSLLIESGPKIGARQKHCRWSAAGLLGGGNELNYFEPDLSAGIFFQRGADVEKLGEEKEGESQRYNSAADGAYNPWRRLIADRDEKAKESNADQKSSYQVKISSPCFESLDFITLFRQQLIPPRRFGFHWQWCDHGLFAPLELGFENGAAVRAFDALRGYICIGHHRAVAMRAFKTDIVGSFSGAHL